MSNGVEAAKMLANGSFDHALENAIEFGIEEGMRQERQRIADILRLPEARSCRGTALMLALHESRMSTEEARDILIAAPVLSADTTNIVDVQARRAALQMIINHGDSHVRTKDGH